MNIPHNKCPPLEHHPLIGMIPQQSVEEMEALIQSIEKYGQLEAISLYEDKILDGRARYQACLKLGMKPKFQRFKEESPLDFVIGKNLNRRNLSDHQRVMLAIDIVSSRRGDNQHSSNELRTQKYACNLLKVRPATLKRALFVQKHAIDSVKHMMRQEKISIAAAAEITQLAREDQEVELKKRLHKKRPVPNSSDDFMQTFVAKKIRSHRVTSSFTPEEWQDIRARSPEKNILSDADLVREIAINFRKGNPV